MFRRPLCLAPGKQHFPTLVDGYCKHCLVVSCPRLKERVKAVTGCLPQSQAFPLGLTPLTQSTKEPNRTSSWGVHMGRSPPCPRKTPPVCRGQPPKRRNAPRSAGGSGGSAPAHAPRRRLRPERGGPGCRRSQPEASSLVSVDLTPSEHPNPTTTIGSEMGEFT